MAIDVPLPPPPSIIVRIPDGMPKARVDPLGCYSTTIVITLGPKDTFDTRVVPGKGCTIRHLRRRFPRR